MSISPVLFSENFNVSVVISVNINLDLSRTYDRVRF